tara:strand:+ start:2153 stop:2887 length:735 start_codon:yes stop_codon:yes gene_type:complete
MLYLRSICFNTFFWTGTPLWILFVLMPLMFCNTDQPMRRAIRVWLRFVIRMLDLIAGIRVEERGVEHLPRDQGFLLCCKHMSNLDAFVVFNRLPDLTALGKKELFRVPLLGQVLKKLNIISIDRQSGTAHKITPQVAQQIKNQKKPLLVYPEGTRTLVGERRKLKSGAFYMQQEADLPVITVATNSGQHWMKRNFRKYPGTVVVEYQPALPRGLSKDDFMKRLEKNILDRSEELMGLRPPSKEA